MHNPSTYIQNDMKTHESTPTEALRSARHWWPFYLNKIEAVVTASGQINAGGDKNYQDIFNSGWLDYCEMVDTHNIMEKEKAEKLRMLLKRDSESNMEKALMELCRAKIREARNHYREKLKFNPAMATDTSEFQRYLQAAIGSASEIDVAVLQHFMWQAKRNLFNLPDRHQLMLIFFGKQYGGKTQAIEKLISPLEELTFKANVNVITDAREYQALADNIIGFWDELAGMQKADMDALKNIITTKDLQYRILGTNTHNKIPRRASFIGASNKSILELMNDPTGMRRFYQFTTLDRLDWVAINKIDYLKMWIAIDESNSDGYTAPYREEILAVQNKFVTKDDVDLFLDYIGYNYDSAGKKFFSGADFYRAYQEWTGKFGHTKLSNSWLGRRLKSRGVESVRNGRTLGYYLNAECTVSELLAGKS